MENSFSPHLATAKNYWKNHLKEGDLAIDATCGNGNDTLFLAEICTVIGMDIQPMAILNTKTLLEKHQKQAILHLISHDQIDEVPLPDKPNLIVYNLGYLPKGNKSITTMTHSTLQSVAKGMVILSPKGALSITCYPGHDEGLKEQKALLEWAMKLPSSDWIVCHHEWLNRPRSPSLIWIAKVQRCAD